MLKKKLMALGIAVIFTLSSLTATVFAADLGQSSTNVSVASKFADRDKDESNGKKNFEKNFKFDDCFDVDWALDAIEKLAGKGIIKGADFGIFKPRENVTHLEALAMVFRLTGDDDEAESNNNKIHPKYKGVMPIWGYGYIYLAIEKGILLPEELNDFNPNKPAKRHEIAKYIIRAMGETEEALDHMDEDLPFRDSNAVPDESVGYVYLINELGIMIGNEKGNFQPMEPVTRAQMAVLLDRAEGDFDIPDTDYRKNNTIFVSVDSDDNEITVKIKGNTVTYDVVEDVQVYKDDSFQTIEDLAAGDVLQLIFNDDKEIIFIEVIQNAEGDEEEISFRTVSYNNLPEVLQDEVDDLKLSENYEAYEYENYIYLVAAMGEKDTGGYDIVFEEIYKVETDDDDFIVKAVIDTDEPSSNDNVTQAITYPYSVVKFKSFDDIDFIRFVDEDDDKLDDVEITDLDETSTVEGEIYDLISSSRKIYIEKSNGTKVSYVIPSSAEIIVNDDDDAEFSDLEEGMNVEIEISDDKVTKVTAEDNDEDDELSFETVAYSELSSILKEQVDYLKLSKNYKAYEYDDYVYLIATMGKKYSNDYKIEITDVSKIEDDDEYTIEVEVEIDTPSSVTSSTAVYPYSVARFENFDDIDVVRFVDEDNDELAETRIVEIDEEVTIEGTINSISSRNKTIKIEKTNGSFVTLTIPSDAEITVNDNEDESFSDLEVGMNVEVKLIDGSVTEVIAEDNITEVNGTLTEISISTVKKITLKVGSTTKTYTVDSDVKVIIDDETARVEDLRIGDELTLKFSNGLLVEIEKE